MSVIKSLKVRLAQGLTALLLLTIACVASAQDLTASVDRNELAINETFTLTLRYSGKQSGGQPDFNLLEQDFEVLSRQQSNQYRVINGRAESFVEWTVILAPLKEGKLFVPSLHLHGEVSDAIPITVNQAGQAPAGQNRKAFLEVETDKEKIFVQEQLLVKVRLYTTVGLHDIATDPLQIPGAHVEKVDERRFERRIDGVGHAVYELTYAVFPESSGELQIPSLNYVAVTGRRDPFSLFNRNAQRIRLRSEAKTIPVEPKPDSYSGSHWLPAASLGLVQSWSKDPEQFKVGEPITRIITLRAEGLRAAQLPPLPELNIDGLKTYPDQPQQEDQPGPSGVDGSRIETTAIVATKPGSYQLPAVTITWWDTKTGRQRATQLPAFRFIVSGASIATPTEGGKFDQSISPTPTTSTVKPGFWQKLAIVAIALHFLWILYFFYLRKNRLTSVTTRKRKKPINPVGAEKLKSLAKDASPQEIQAGLREWLHSRWPNLGALGLEAATKQLGISELSQIVEILNDTTYKAPPKPINRPQLQILVERLIRQEDHVDVKTKELPDLFTGGTA
ncbi:BatD family protein [Microbulbifer agarilyticus]|uniref:BatD family protein n=1 Tax=Microbulbifer agarilyticus TaxID=260552 RepID=UPI001CD30862|nr:BatD family protein [Microbulbifer agarilyticus]MCA0901414.1 BatD family protein [Microbulbifer agarilyticus]